MGTVAALGLIGGSLALGALTAPEPEPETVVEVAPTTTSTTVDDLETPLDLENFKVDQIAIGEPLLWERAAGVDGVFGQHLVQHGDDLYLFGSFTDIWEPGPSATVVWRSSDGRNWESLGTVLETQHPLQLVSSTPRGLIAVELGQPDPTVWRSNDAIDWERETVPSGESPYSTSYPTAVAANADVMVLTGNRQTDVTPLLQERLDMIGVEVDLHRFGWGQEHVDGEMRFVVYGPLGIHLTELSTAEMALPEDQVDALNQGGDQAETSVWVRHEGLDWQQRTIEGASWVESLTFDGPRLIAFGYGQVGSTTWASDDGGLTWEEIGSAAGHPYDLVRWGERYVGLQQGGVVDLRVSEDGLTWEEADLDEHLPHQVGWSPWALSAGEGGIAFVAEGWRNSGMEPTPTPSSLTRDGVTLSVNPQVGEFELTVDGNIFNWQMYTGQPQEGIVVDIDTEQVHFHDPDSGERLASFTIDELSEAEQSYWPETRGGESFQAFVYSPDAVDWTIQDVEDDFGEGTRVFSISITDDAVVALVNSWKNLYGTEPGFEIWTAPIP